MAKSRAKHKTTPVEATVDASTLGSIKVRMSEDAIAAFDEACKGKNNADMLALAHKCSELGMQNRNGRIFLETVKRAVES